MPPIAKNILAVMAGFFAGSFVNMMLVNLGPVVIPLPEGADISSMEKLKESMEMFKPANFLFPFLGHALGTLTAAFIAAKLAASHQMKFAMGLGAFFLFGGIMMVKLVGGPIWFAAVDLGLAYLPMGYLGGALARKKQTEGTGPDDS